MKGFEDSILEWRMEIWPARDAPKDIVIIGVDDISFKTAQMALDPATLARAPELAYMTNTWPWNREIWAKLTERLMGAVVKLVVYDFVFNGPTPGDADSGAVFAKYADPKNGAGDKPGIHQGAGCEIGGAEWAGTIQLEIAGNHAGRGFCAIGEHHDALGVELERHANSQGYLGELMIGGLIEAERAAAQIDFVLAVENEVG